MPDPHPDALSRRAAVGVGVLWLTPGLLASRPAWADDESVPPPAPALTVGLITDPHAADKAPAGSRHYRASAAKFAAAVNHFNNTRCQLAVCLGDIVDRAELELEIAYLKAIEAVYARFRGDRRYVLGNHCVDTLTKDEFIAHTAKQSPHESFDLAGWHFVILDACFTKEAKPYGRRNFDWTDSNIPPDQLRWLEADLKATKLPSVVFAHQSLDRPDNDPYAVKNAAAVRQILARSAKVRAVFQGHRHVNDLTTHDHIPYITLRGMIEGPDEKTDNAYSTLACYPDGTLRLDGFGQQTHWPRAKPG